MTRMRNLRWVGVATVVAAGVVAAACGGNDYTSGATTTGSAATVPNTEAPKPTAPSVQANTPAPQSAAGTQLRLKDAPGVGKVFATSEGMTLYVFNNDSTGKSACNGGCAATWPPLKAAGGSSMMPEGVAGEASIITRDDGSKQVALNGKPLYTYAADKNAGDAKGEGVGGVWFVAKANSAAASPPSTSGDAYGY
ncbi:MAG: hypothetical protein ABI782_00165 [Anaerolineaceae bacterium]